MVYILSNEQGSNIAGNKGPLILSAGFGSKVNELILHREHEHVDVLQKGSSRIAPLDAPHIVSEVHTLYANAGAHILTADTFCASISRQKGDINLIKNFIESAANLAQAVSLQSPLRPLVALSLTASGDCYDPLDTPDDQTLKEEHSQNIALMASHGDLILAETLPTLREGVVISSLSEKSKKPFFASFVVDEQGLVLDGSTMAEVVKFVLQPNSHCLGVGVNCCSTQGAQRAVSELSEIFAANQNLSSKHIIAYPNGFKYSIEENRARGGDPEVYTAEEWTELLSDLVKEGATGIGGCCGTDDKHTHQYSKIEFATPAHAFA